MKLEVNLLSREKNVKKTCFRIKTANFDDVQPAFVYGFVESSAIEGNEKEAAEKSPQNTRDYHHKVREPIPARDRELRSSNDFNNFIRFIMYMILMKYIFHMVKLLR